MRTATKIRVNQNENQHPIWIQQPIEKEEQKVLQEVDADSEKDKNEEAAESERNCTLDEMPNMNNPDGQRNYSYVENLDEQEILKIIQEPV